MNLCIKSLRAYEKSYILSMQEMMLKIGYLYGYLSITVMCCFFFLFLFFCREFTDVIVNNIIKYFISKK